MRYRRVLGALAHTRIVPTPLYRLMLLAWLVSGIVCLFYGPSASIQSQGPAWFDWTFVGLQITGSALALVGLYSVENNTQHATRLHLSLNLELLGLILLQTVIALQITATTFDQGRPPVTGGTWMAAIFCVWSFIRARDILRAVSALSRREGP